MTRGPSSTSGKLSRRGFATGRAGEVTRGQGDAEKNRIFAEAFGQDPNFFGFYRSMTAYTASLKGENTTVILSPDSEFFRYFSGGANAGGR